MAVVAVLVVGNGDPVRADPTTPQLGPLHGQREDAQRLWEQLHNLDRQAAPEPLTPPSLQTARQVEPALGQGVVVDDRPLSQRWWFWAIAGAVAVTAIGVTYETTRGSAPRLPGVTCDAGGCHP
jgi:hypothetical protein